MSRRVCALLLGASCSALVAASCGTVESDNDPDGRPLELAYLTGAIFAPSCGQTQCHSKFKQAGNLVFDNPDDAARSLLAPDSGPLLNYTSEQNDPRRTDGYKPNLLVWLTEIDPFMEGIGRMPFDAPLPQRDIELIEAWIRIPPAADGDLPGAGGRGAQCDPDLYAGLACNDDELVKCTDDFNFGEPQESCINGCEIAGICDDAPPDFPASPCNIPLRRVAQCRQL